MLYLNPVLILSALFIFGCASSNKAMLSTDNPKQAIIEIERLSDDLRNDQVDFLADEQFANGSQKLDDAKKIITANGDKSLIMGKLSESKAHFIGAKTIANSREEVPKRILKARKSALESGMSDDQEWQKDLKSVDESLRRRTDDFTKSLRIGEISDFEQEYMRLEVVSVQNRELRRIRSIIFAAQNNRAPKIASKTYHSALNDLKAAENTIQQSPRNPDVYKLSVAKANASAKLLKAVMSKLDGPKKMQQNKSHCNR